MPHVREKTFNLRQFSLEEQKGLIAAGKRLINEAGGVEIAALQPADAKARVNY